ncbi:MAG: UDP-N-acetylmuramate--L-alanine ligase [Patescibacteria group bacterium]|jgi:UDP-N-acetylmuramate--alanine ligase
MDLKDYQNIYFLGIKGAGMTAMAQMLKKIGKNVWGSDIPETFFTDEVLAKDGIKVLSPFAAGNITDDIDLIIYSTAYNEKNEEFKFAKEKGMTMLSYPQSLGLLFKDHYGIAVCGAHGKTTTTAMLGYVLQELGQDPLVIVGSAVDQLGGNARFGQGKYLVVEADEYQNKLQYYSPKAVILTSADFDHPDFFADQNAYNQVFKDFVARIPVDGLLIAFVDDANVAEIIRQAKCRVIEYHKNQKGLPTINLQLSGEHNIWNATAILLLLKELGLDIDKAAEVLSQFKGTKRRFEFLGEKDGILVYDDFAHHPVEIQKLLKAARTKFPGKKIWAVFQAHTYTRTKALLKEFGESFTDADEVIVLDIFGSAREEHGGVTTKQLVDEIDKNSHNASYRGTIDDVTKYLRQNAKTGDVIMTIGAGENWQVGVNFLENI